MEKDIFLRQIGATASPSLQQKRLVLSQYLILLQVRNFLDNLPHMSEYIPSQQALLYIFQLIHLLCVDREHPSTSHNFLPSGNGTSAQVSFFCYAFISSSITWIHLGLFMASFTVLGTPYADNL